MRTVTYSENTQHSTYLYNSASYRAISPSTHGIPTNTVGYSSMSRPSTEKNSGTPTLSTPRAVQIRWNILSMTLNIWRMFNTLIEPLKRLKLQNYLYLLLSVFAPVQIHVFETNLKPPNSDLELGLKTLKRPTTSN